ncbi:MAG: SpoIIE family protein phosphatase [Gammaproteobacteria bacterium]|nr:SpoIIE family protein phosphatase [Gammaproteobacteria bacterium]MDH5629920.1 SpoIIE family protein phosphatase [Gammaproteobacteria bacterium]
MIVDASAKLDSHNSKKILIIDDERLVRESMSIYLQDSGYQTIEAVDGKDGLEMFHKHLPDLVLCDLRMPQMDGLEVLKQLTSSSPDIPIIIVSGAGQIQDVVEALRLGALDYLVKPVTDMAVLENAVKNSLKRFDLEEQNKQHKEELQKANTELEKNLSLLQKDQEAGRQAQLQLLPEPHTELNGYNFEHIIIPSLNLSGDFIDYFQISPRYTGFYIADVSGHGVAAAFVTMILKSLVNQPLRQFRTGESDEIIRPEEFLEHLNKELLNANLGKHITIFYGVIDCQNHVLSYASAGQYPAPVVVNDGNINLLTTGGFPLGLFEWADFDSHHIDLSEDFKILMVSDGWLDIISENFEVVEENFLTNYVKSNPLTMTSMLAPVKQCAKGLMPDDITVFIITRNI